MGIPDLRDTFDLGKGYEGREFNYPYDNPGLGTAAVDWEERIDIKRMREERLAKAQQAVKNAGVDALFIFRLENLKYLTSYRVHDWPIIFFGLASCLLINGEDPYVFTMDVDHAKLRMPWVADRTFEECGGGLETSDGVRNWAMKTKELMAKSGIKNPEKIGLDGWNQAMMEELPKVFPKTKFVDGQFIMLEARKCKTIDEINMLKLAYSVTAAGFAEGLRVLKPGIRECEVLGAIWGKFTALGSEWTQCANIVCSGPYTAPYRRFTSDRLIEYGDLVIIDVGARINGYYGDFTRVWVCGDNAKPSPKQVDLHIRAREAMLRAEAAIKPGAVTTDIFEACGKENTLGGCLGHGLGIASFEPPYISEEYMVPREKAYVLEPGMIFSIEPYVGAPGIGGIRLEDNILVTDHGMDIISRFPFDNRLLR